MAVNQFIPRFKPGQSVPAIAQTGHTVRGGRFVKIAADKDDAGNYVIVECGAGDRAFGVTEYDCDDTNGQRTNVNRGAIARVAPGSAITAGDSIQSDSQGRALTLASAIAASLATGVVGSDNAITWTARTPGVGGNSITVHLVDPGGTSATLSVDVAEDGLAITVNLGRAASAINSTAQNVMDAIEANGLASSLVKVASTSTSNGSGLVAAVSTTPLAGGLDPQGGAHQLGTAVQSCDSDARFVEIATT